MFNRREVIYWRWGQRSFENARACREDLFGTKIIANATVVISPRCLIRKFGRLEGARKNLRDADFARIRKLDGTLTAFDRIKKAQEELAKIAPLYNYLEQERPNHGWLSRAARPLLQSVQICARLLRAIDERAKPNNERFAEFRDSANRNRSSLIFSPPNRSTTIRNSVA